MNINLIDKLKCIQPQMLLNKIENETGPLRPDTNIFILLIKKCKKPAPKVGYK